MAPMFVHAVQTCELEGQSVNPNNGNTTAGKSGLMRCREGDGGPVVREQELRAGVFMGIVRYYERGVLQREFSVNERGNRDGRSREYAATPGGPNPLLREETLRDGTTTGLARTWYADGTLKRASFNGDDGREQAAAEFTPGAKLSELRCGLKPLLGPDADDAAWCGFGRSGSATVDLYSASGAVRAHLTFERGERRRSETLWDNGKPREQDEQTAAGGTERSFAADGVKRREVVWVSLNGDGRASRATTLEREFHESGTLMHERRWLPQRFGPLQLDQHWYLNGQPRDRVEYLAVDDQPIRRETRYHDNGQVASLGEWSAKPRGESVPIGVHKTFDEGGRLRGERYHDARGRLSREREFDDAGTVLRDDELFEDGSRKAYRR